MWENYKEKVIFITGASGFLGTALVYRLVTKAPVKHIYILTRGGFTDVRKKWLEWLPRETAESMSDPDRVTVVKGDLLKDGLDIALPMKQILAEQVNIVIHCASSINLQSPLVDTSRTVVDASERVARLALSWPHVKSFVYVSTAYCNTHLGDVEVKEAIYNPSSGDPNSLAQEAAQVREPAAKAPPGFLWAYAYAKNLTERLLCQIFQATDKRFLIVRPSIIGPSQCFPYYQFCIPASCPPVTATAALCLTPTRTARFASQLHDPQSEATFDEVPVDVVADRLLVHVALGTTGVVHATGGTPVRFEQWWDQMLDLRSFPWPLKVKWTTPDMPPRKLHPVARLMKVIGMSFRFSQEKTCAICKQLEEKELSDLQLFRQDKDGRCELRAGRRQLWYCMDRFTRKRWWARKAAQALYGTWAYCAPDEARTPQRQL